LKKTSAFYVAIRYLWSRAHEGVRYLRGAAAGIAISLVPIIVTLIVADGMIRGILDRYIELGTGHLQVVDLTRSVDNDEVIRLINGIDGVRGVWPEQRGMGVIAGRSGKTGVTVRAIEPSFWEDQGSASLLITIEGEKTPGTNRYIVLGEMLAHNIGVKTGDTVRLMTVVPQDNGRMSTRTASFTVRGILSCGYNELDALWCIISYEGGRRVFSYDQLSTNFIVKIDDPYRRADAFSWELYRYLESGYSVLSWVDLLDSQHKSYKMTRQLLLFIMALIVIIAAVNVSSATSMLVLERQRDIAVLKVSGASVNGVTRVFLWGSFLTGLTGSVIGIAAGLLIGVNINFLVRTLEKLLSFVSNIYNGSEVKILDPGFYLETIPVVIDWKAVLMISVFAILCSVIASLIPAVKAGKLKPMDLLRKT